MLFKVKTSALVRLYTRWPEPILNVKALKDSIDNLKGVEFATFLGLTKETARYFQVSLLNHLHLKR